MPKLEKTIRRQAGTHESGVSCLRKGGFDVGTASLVNFETPIFHFVEWRVRNDLFLKSADRNFSNFTDRAYERI